MSKKSVATVKRALRSLRREVIAGDDPIAARVAYEVETAVRWATEDTVDWPPLADSVRSTADLIRRDLLQRLGLDGGE